MKNEAGFTMTGIPIEALADPKITRLALRVLVAIGTFSSFKTGRGRAAQSTIGDILGVKRQRVQKALDELVEAGYVAKMGRFKRCLVLQMLTPPSSATPVVAQSDTADTENQMQPQGGQNPEPTGVAQTTIEQDSPLTPLCEPGARGGPLRPSHGRSPGGSLSEGVVLSAGASAPLSPPPGGLPSGEGKKFFVPSLRSFSTQAPKDPLQIAGIHLSRSNYADLVTLAKVHGTENALKQYGFDKYGRKKSHVRAAE